MYEILCLYIHTFFLFTWPSNSPLQWHIKVINNGLCSSINFFCNYLINRAIFGKIVDMKYVFLFPHNYYLKHFSIQEKHFCLILIQLYFLQFECRQPTVLFNEIIIDFFFVPVSKTIVLVSYTVTYSCLKQLHKNHNMFRLVKARLQILCSILCNLLLTLNKQEERKYVCLKLHEAGHQT